MNALTKTESGALAISDAEMLNVLQNSLYPGAAIESIKLVLSYCKAAKLDPMQKPVHIVPMWNAKAGRTVDVVMPGVNLYRTQAMRSGECAGVSEPEFGPDVNENIGGAQITYPQWCRVTIQRRLPTGEIAAFTAREFWKENYAVRGGKEKSIAPNAMWSKRPYGQVAKCAEAQALRKAFPEIASQPTADEMEGKAMHMDEPNAPVTDYVDPQMFIDSVGDCATDADALAYWKAHNGKLAKQPADHQAFKDAVAARRTQLKNAQATDVQAKAKTFDEVMAMLYAATTIDALYVASDWIDSIADSEQQGLLNEKFGEIKEHIEASA
jgi:phage recombination protein Bet